MKENVFDKINNWVNSVEGSIVNLLTALAPWLSPIIPAYMTFQHMKDFLLFPEWIAFIAAAIVEILGFSTVSTFLEFWFFNRREKSGKAKAPVGIVIGVFVFYLFLIITTNVVIDISKSFFDDYWQKWAIVIVRTLLACQTVPAVFIVAARTSHKNLLDDIKKEKQERKEERMESSKKFPNIPENIEESSKKPEDWRKLRPTLSQDDLIKLANLTPDGMRKQAEKTGYTYKTLSNWRTRAREELNMIDDNSSEKDSDGWPISDTDQSQESSQN